MAPPTISAKPSRRDLAAPERNAREEHEGDDGERHGDERPLSPANELSIEKATPVL
jgi:hypothetical protein